jgi:DNA polymerase III subunit gamma/tau
MISKNFWLALNIRLIEASDDTKRKYAEVAKEFSADDLLRLLHLSSEGQLSIKDAHQPRIHFEITLLKLVKMERLDGLKALIQEIRALRSGTVLTPNQSNPSTGTENPIGNVAAPSTAPSSDAYLDSYRAKLQQNPAPKPGMPGTKNSIGTNPILGSHLSVVPKPEPLQIGEASVVLDGANALKAEPKKESLINESSNLGPVPLHLVTKNWGEFLQRTQTELQATFHLIIKRTRPIDIKENTVVLEVSDDFTADIIESNKRDIARVLSECIGQRVQVDSRLVKSVAEHRSNDPFERFKKLQEKDPILRAVVELFGAELDYNI